MRELTVPLLFQSTPPVKAATEAADRPESWIRFQSTPPVKAATRLPMCHCVNHAAISIHAAREGGDQATKAIHQTCRRFQSTPPVKAATQGCRTRRCGARFQSTPPVKAATFAFERLLENHAISIHAAREGGDDFAPGELDEALDDFNPRRP